jgi:hypothetical protein
MNTPAEKQNTKQDGPSADAGEEKTDGFKNWANEQFVGSQIWWEKKFQDCWQAAIAHAKSQPSEVASVPTVEELMMVYNSNRKSPVVGSAYYYGIEAVREAMQRWFVKTLDHFTESGKCVVCGTVGGTVVSTKDYMAEVEARKTAEYKLESAEAELASLKATLEDSSDALWRRDYAESQLTSLQKERDDLKAKLAEVAQIDWRLLCHDISEVWWWCYNNGANLQHGDLDFTGDGGTMFSVVLCDVEVDGAKCFHDKTPRGAMEKARASDTFKAIRSKKSKTVGPPTERALVLDIANSPTAEAEKEKPKAGPPTEKSLVLDIASPLPATPAPMVPLEAGDVPPGSVIAMKPYGTQLSGAWHMVVHVCTKNGHVWLTSCSGAAVKYTFRELMNFGYVIQRPGQDWQPCSKEEA